MRCSTRFAGAPQSPPIHALTVAIAAGVFTIGCSQPAEIGPVQIQPIAVPGPPAGWDMSTRLMNRQSASTATLSGAGDAPSTAAFGRISASMYYDPASREPFTGTVVMRADSLADGDAALKERLEAWLEPASYPAFIFQSSGSTPGVDGYRVDGQLFVRDQVVPATSRWSALEPLAQGEDLRMSARFGATIEATVPGSPFAGGAIRIDLELPVVGFTPEFVANLLESDGIDVAALTAADPSYPSSASDLSNVAWYLMLAGHTAQALDVYRMSLDESAALNTYLRMSDGYVFDGQYDMAVGSYRALQQYTPGQPHGLELIKILGGNPLDTDEVAEINGALVGS